MRKIYIENVKGTEKVAKPILDAEGRILLAKGMPLRLHYISKLKEMGVVSLYIEDQFSEGIEPESSLSELVFEKSKNQIKNIIKSTKQSKEIDTEEIGNVVEQIMDELLYEEDVLIHAGDILFYDEYTYAHSIHVCVLSIIMGKALGYSIPRIKELAIGALLHDLGKIFVPEEILNKPNKLTTEEFRKIQLHPQDGYQVLRPFREISGLSKLIVLGHHEKIDGTGYPAGLKGDQIHEAVRLVSICDVFAAMTSDRVYRKKIKTYEVIEYLIAMSGQAFDASLVSAFIDHIVIYPTGQGVLLNTGEKGIVVKQNRHMTSRPIVRIFWNAKGEKISPYEIDMTKETTIFIIDQVDL